MTVPPLQFLDVHTTLGATEILRGVTLQVRAGHVHFIMGRSGAGKSVLIKHVVGLLRCTSGKICLYGEDISQLLEQEFPRVRRRCQLIFQHATLFEHLTVLENIAMPLRRRFKLARAAANTAAAMALSQVHAEHLVRRFPNELGAGLQKRIAVARAVALKPDILLFDEPTTGLDPIAARRTDRLIADLARTGLTAVVVSHDLRSMRAIANRVSFLHAGAIYFDGMPDAFMGSDDPALQSFTRQSA